MAGQKDLTDNDIGRSTIGKLEVPTRSFNEDLPFSKKPLPI
jgi:hypothetical protein